MIPLDAQLCFSLYSASMTIGRLYKPLLDELDLTYPQYLALATLWEQDGLTVSGIARRLDLEPSTITPIVKRLESVGLVKRRRNPSNEREVQVHLSAIGKGMEAKMGCLTDSLLRNSQMTPEQMIRLNGEVRSLRAAIVKNVAGHEDGPAEAA